MAELYRQRPDVSAAFLPGAGSARPDLIPALSRMSGNVKFHSNQSLKRAASLSVSEEAGSDAGSVSPVMSGKTGVTLVVC